MPQENHVFGFILSLIITIFLVVTAFATFVIVPAGYRGVVLNLGAVEDRVLGEGFHIIIPYIESVQTMEVRTQKYEIDCSSATKDLLDVNTKIAVNYKLSENLVNKVYQTMGMDYRERVIAPAVQEVVKATTANFNAEELIAMRPTVKQQIENTLKERLSSRDIIVEIISLTDFKFPEQFNDAITSKQTAVQLKLKAVNDLERIKVEAQQAIEKAKGEAESTRVVNEELMKSPLYLQFLAVNRWDGKLPLVVSPNSVPFLLSDALGVNNITGGE
jgi:regulator of protease activity HflC (stomatin/prohibitin superfamily)